jgi:uncharacterized YccA/Bax inhibitor family protein
MAQLMRTSNPALNDKAFRGLSAETGLRMTLSGLVNKTAILLLCSVVTAGWTWHVLMKSQSAAAVLPWMWIGTIGGFVLAMITIFKKEWSPVTAPA